MKEYRAQFNWVWENLNTILKVLAVRLKPYFGPTRYTALFDQIGTNDPIVTVIENTTCLTCTWTRKSVGVYVGELSCPISTEKLFINGFTKFEDGAGVANAPCIEIASFTYPRYGRFTIYPNSNNGLTTSITVQTNNEKDVPFDWYELTTIPFTTATSKLNIEFLIYK